MRRHAKAPSAITAASMGTTPARRTVFGAACLCVLGLTAFLGSSAPSVGAAESFPGQGFLPNNRAWEMVSPPDKNGGGVMALTSRTRAASSGDAVQYSSLTGFADVVGMAVSADYLAQRSGDPDPGDNGWSTHAITPPLEANPFGNNVIGGESKYEGDLSENLSQGLFLSATPLTGAPNVSTHINLYLRDDLLEPGPGNYELLTDCLSPPAGPCEGPYPALFNTLGGRPSYAGASEDLDHVIFESKLALANGAMANPFLGAINLYESADGELRIAGILPDGSVAARSIAGRGVSPGSLLRSTSHPISADGSHIFFTTQREAQDADGHIYARVNGHITYQLNASERSTPLPGEPATYQDASISGDRVFFLSPEPLTDDAPGGSSEKAYMWEKQPIDETQQLTVDAGAGAFTLSLRSVPVEATGTLTENSSQIESISLTSGAFAVGQSITGPGIPPGTTITEVGNSSLTLSQSATASGTEAISAGYTSTSAPLPFDATAAQVQAVLEALPAVGTGNVTVSGGPGAPGAGTPYSIAFGDELAGVNVPQLETDSTGLSGGAATATVSTTQAVENLTLINVDSEPADGQGGVEGLTGVSEKGDYVYFMARGQLVAGKSLNLTVGLYLWHEGVITYIGRLAEYLNDREELRDGASINLVPKEAQVSPDGRHFLFSSRSGIGLLSARGGADYDHGSCGTGCRELYLYSADTDKLQCTSCNPTGALATAAAQRHAEAFNGGAQFPFHLNNALSEDGRYVFFTSGDKLVEADTNGVRDAYVFDSVAGKAHLLSSGESAAPSYFLESSASGNDVFFVTAERLSRWDVDTAYDLYDARVDGGFPEPAPAPPSCQGDACQPTPLALNDPTPSSSGFSGPGNEIRPKGRKRCAKDRRQVKRGGKARCMKRGKQNRNANNDRRAGR